MAAPECRPDEPSLAVVGVSGTVWQEFLRVLTNRDFPYCSIRILASFRSAGKRPTFEDRDYAIEELKEDSFYGIDVSLFSAGVLVSKAMGPAAVARGAVDNSSAFRMIPPCLPEVNRMPWRTSSSSSAQARERSSLILIVPLLFA